jgi:hypothetical protein
MILMEGISSDEGNSRAKTILAVSFEWMLQFNLNYRGEVRARLLRSFSAVTDESHRLPATARCGVCPRTLMPSPLFGCFVQSPDQDNSYVAARGPFAAAGANCWSPLAINDNRPHHLPFKTMATMISAIRNESKAANLATPGHDNTKEPIEP